MSEEPKITRKIVKIQEVAEQFGVSVRTIERWVEAGKFPRPLRIGLRYRGWLRVQVENVIEQARQESAK